MAFASNFQYHDYVKESDYRGPTPVNDTLIDNCRNLKIDQSVCDATDSANLTRAEKKVLILAAMNPQVDRPDYGFISGWNNAIPFGKSPPIGVKSLSSGAIRDAWVRIVDISPSVAEGNRTLLNSSGNLLAEYAFTFVLPDEPAPGNCKTTYSADGYNYSLGLFQNGSQINKNNEIQANFRLNGTSVVFDANLSIVAGYKARHYVWVTHCDDDGDCHETCEYAYTENVTDLLNISDSESGYLYNLSYSARSIVDKNHSGLFDFWFKYSVGKDFSEIRLDSGNAQIRVKGTAYRLKTAFEPYNILGYEAVPINDSVFSHYATILYDNQSENETTANRTIRALIPASDDCTLTFLSHFDKAVIPRFCNVTNATPQINVSVITRTNVSTLLELSFFDNSSGEPLPGKLLNIRYGGQELNATTSNSGKARINLPISSGIVRISFTTDFETKSSESIFVIAPEVQIDENAIFGAVLLALVIFLIYRIAKRWFPNA